MVGAFGGPTSLAVAVAVAAGLIGALVVLLSFEDLRWGAVAWWGTIAAFVLGLVLLAVGMPAVGLVLLVAGPITLAAMAWIQPGLALRYLPWRKYGPSQTPPTARQVAVERTRLTAAAAVALLVGIAVAVAGVWPRGGTGGPPAGGAGGSDTALVARGRELYTRFGCAACHGPGGSGTAAGPALRGKLGAQERLASGAGVLVDEAYLRESILQPDAKIVQGYAPGVMPAATGPYTSQLQQPENLDALIAYIKSLR